jgi:hypothetical protein
VVGFNSGVKGLISKRQIRFIFQKNINESLYKTNASIYKNVTGLLHTAVHSLMIGQ